jgi:hypothetical protein
MYFTCQFHVNFQLVDNGNVHVVLEKILSLNLA